MMTDYKEQWNCISNCGACCRLAPLERLEALEALSPAEEVEYLKMVGQDGWCIHYDSGSRSCRIYKDRPEFCRVCNLKRFFDLANEEPQSIAISFCRQHIRAVYGGKSKEMKKFQKELRIKKKKHE